MIFEKEERLAHKLEDNKNNKIDALKNELSERLKELSLKEPEEQQAYINNLCSVLYSTAGHNNSVNNQSSKNLCRLWRLIELAIYQKGGCFRGEPGMTRLFFCVL